MSARGLSAECLSLFCPDLKTWLQERCPEFSRLFHTLCRLINPIPHGVFWITHTLGGGGGGQILPTSV